MAAPPTFSDAFYAMREEIIMKSAKSRRLLCLLLIGLSVLYFAGCKGSGIVGSTYVEPELTVEYLTSDFSDQLIRDGAEKKFGTIANIIDNGNGSYMLSIDEKQFVSDDGQPNGFYIADRNLNYDLYLASNARSVFFPGGDSTKAVFFESSNAFIDSLKEDISVFSPTNSEYTDYQLFYFYVIHNEVVLIVQQYIP